MGSESLQKHVPVEGEVFLVGEEFLGCLKGTGGAKEEFPFLGLEMGEQIDGFPGGFANPSALGIFEDVRQFALGRHKGENGQA